MCRPGKEREERVTPPLSFRKLVLRFSPLRVLWRRGSRGSLGGPRLCPRGLPAGQHRHRAILGAVLPLVGPRGESGEQVLFLLTKPRARRGGLWATRWLALSLRERRAGSWAVGASYQAGTPRQTIPTKGRARGRYVMGRNSAEVLSTCQGPESSFSQARPTRFRTS